MDSRLRGNDIKGSGNDIKGKSIIFWARGSLICKMLVTIFTPWLEGIIL